MIRLTTLNNNALTLLCSDVSLPIHDTLQVENKLLDGSLHIQTIGEPLKTILIEVLATETNAEKIDVIESIKEEVYFYKKTKIYRGIIRKPIKWTKRSMYTGNTTKYSGEVEFVILGEGSI